MPHHAGNGCTAAISDDFQLIERLCLQLTCVDVAHAGMQEDGVSPPVSILVAAFLCPQHPPVSHYCIFFSSHHHSPPICLSAALGAKSHVGVSACRWDKYAIVGKGYAKMDTEITMKMNGELFEASSPS